MTIMNGYSIISKSEFKPKALEYLRLVEHHKLSLIISHRGKPVVKLVPVPEAEKPADSLKSLRGSVIKYKLPFAPVAADDWEILKQ